MGRPSSRGMLALSGALVLVSALLVLVLVGAVGSGGSGSTPPTGAIAFVDGVPIGTEDSRQGALAAADNYLAFASQSIEQDPSSFAALVGHDYAQSIRARTLAEAQKLRARDFKAMSNYAQGGRAIAVIAAHRLDAYTPGQATITSWLGGFVWGPHLAPRQSWNLVETTLRWQAGRWVVLASSGEAIAAPVPSIVYVDGANDTSQAFARLSGMSAPYYSAGG